MTQPEPTPAGTPRVSVVLCCYTLKRWDDIARGVSAVGAQTLRPEVIIVVVDHNDELLTRAAAELPGLTDVAVEVIANADDQGLSGARNTGIRHARTEAIAFLDDDACPEPTWLAEMAAELADEHVVVVGGRSVPGWPDERPGWFPPEFDWVVGSSYRGMPVVSSDVRNVHGASMLFRAATFAQVGGFAEGVGRIGVIPLGCEETELCIRISQDIPDARIRYVPTSVVRHRVSEDRVRYRYFVTRCWAEGLSKALISTMVGREESTSDERAYSTKVLPRAVLGDLRRAVTGTPVAALRAATIVVGFVVTAAGFARGTVAQRRR